ncbi:MAG TPA: prolipoprotein diacylglyceryl transferase [Stellaceae bacterium]|jgi:phosphatidylglycerol:prolipoprotein diacylglycerol transferase|nr:prolipoprotein diacylglyceryl transferase [Stellaceae bacterium]
MLLLLPYPHINPVALAIGPLAIRWYALAYIFGLLIGWRYCVYLAKRPPYLATAAHIDDFLTWATIGVVLGGRIGYVLFYNDTLYWDHPLEILEVWHGGMSFHGGCAGVILALYLFARRQGIPMFGLADIVACAVPIGLFFGRLANFINGELFGRVTDVPWAMIFPNGGPFPRHPSQLYQATLEGIVLFVILTAMERRGLRRRPGMICGTFLVGYAIARSTGELFRQPDPQLGFLIFGTTMGQLLSLPMIFVGLWLIWRAKRLPPVSSPVAAD